jgi:hypothetical protein
MRASALPSRPSMQGRQLQAGTCAQLGRSARVCMSECMGTMQCGSCEVHAPQAHALTVGAVIVQPSAETSSLYDSSTSCASSAVSSVAFTEQLARGVPAGGVALLQPSPFAPRMASVSSAALASKSALSPTTVKLNERSESTPVPTLILDGYGQGVAALATAAQASTRTAVA